VGSNYKTTVGGLSLNEFMEQNKEVGAPVLAFSLVYNEDIDKYAVRVDMLSREGNREIEVFPLEAAEAWREGLEAIQYEALEDSKKRDNPTYEGCKLNFHEEYKLDRTGGRGPYPGNEKQ
jgi:hypothetical protein